MANLLDQLFHLNPQTPQELVRPLFGVLAQSGGLEVSMSKAVGDLTKTIITDVLARDDFSKDEVLKIKKWFARSKKDIGLNDEKITLLAFDDVVDLAGFLGTSQPCRHLIPLLAQPFWRNLGGDLLTNPSVSPEKNLKFWKMFSLSGGEGLVLQNGLIGSCLNGLKQKESQDYALFFQKLCDVVILLQTQKISTLIDYQKNDQPSPSQYDDMMNALASLADVTEDFEHWRLSPELSAFSPPAQIKSCIDLTVELENLKNINVQSPTVKKIIENLFAAHLRKFVLRKHHGSPSSFNEEKISLIKKEIEDFFELSPRFGLNLLRKTAQSAFKDYLSGQPIEKASWFLVEFHKSLSKNCNRNDADAILMNFAMSTTTTFDQKGSWLKKAMSLLQDPNQSIQEALFFDAKKDPLACWSAVAPSLYQSVSGQKAKAAVELILNEHFLAQMLASCSDESARNFLISLPHPRDQKTKKEKNILRLQYRAIGFCDASFWDAHQETLNNYLMKCEEFKLVLNEVRSHISQQDLLDQINSLPDQNAKDWGEKPRRKL